MSVADPRSAVTSEPAAPAAPQPPATRQWPTQPPAARQWPTQPPASSPAPSRRRGSDVDRALALGVAAAWIGCLLVEPIPEGDVHIPLWQFPIEFAALGSIVAAVVALWRGSRYAPRLGVIAGALMAVVTMACLFAGHSSVGWWTWVQAGLSLAVMATGAALHRRVPATPPGA